MSMLPWELRFDLVPCGLAVSADYHPVDHRLELTLHNDGGEPVAPGTVEFVAELALPAVSGYAWIHGRHSHSPALIHRFGDPLEAGSADGFHAHLEDGGEHYHSDELVGLYAPARAMPALVIGSLRGDQFFTGFEVELGEDEIELAALRIAVDLEATTVEPGASLALPPLWVADGADVFDLARQYADALGSAMNARVPHQVSAGWRSGQAFGNAVSEQDIAATLAWLRERRLPIEFVQVDDGYQAAVGDWLTPNEHFPAGLTSLATQIREAGYRPGLWLAPLLLHESSNALREYPEVALKDHDGEILYVETWLGRCAVLDCSHPAAQSWLGTVVSVLVHDWGFDYLALDGLAYAAQTSTEAAYHNRSFTAARNLRRGLEIIRAAAGERAFLVGAMCPFAPAVGLVDAMRVAGDLVPGDGDSLRSAMGTALQRNFMHLRWWANDPGPLAVGGVAAGEARLLFTAIALTGGMVVSSDKLPALPEERLRLLEALLPPAGVGAAPYDAGTEELPSGWRAAIDEERALVGVLNWTDERAWVHVDEYLAAGELAFDVLQGKMLGQGDVPLEPFDGTLWQVTRTGRGARVVGDAAHVNYGHLYQRPVSGRIQVGNDLDRPRTIAVEARRRVFLVTLQPGERRWFD